MSSAEGTPDHRTKPQIQNSWSLIWKWDWKGFHRTVSIFRKEKQWKWPRKHFFILHLAATFWQREYRSIILQQSSGILQSLGIISWTSTTSHKYYLILCKDHCNLFWYPGMARSRCHHNPHPGQPFVGSVVGGGHGALGHAGEFPHCVQ